MATMSVALVVLSIRVWFFIGIRHLWIRITQTGKIGSTWTRIEIAQYRVIPIIGLHLRYFRIRVGDITEGNRICWADLLASDFDVTIGDTNIIGSASEAFLLDLSRFDTLRAEGALLHYTAHTHCDIWIRIHLFQLRLVNWAEWTLIEFTDLALVPVEEVKATDLVRTVVRAVASTHAAIIRHRVETRSVVYRRIDWANLLTRRILTVLTHHAHVRHLHIIGHFSLVVLFR